MGEAHRGRRPQTSKGRGSSASGSSEILSGEAGTQGRFLGGEAGFLISSKRVGVLEEDSQCPEIKPSIKWALIRAQIKRTKEGIIRSIGECRVLRRQSQRKQIMHRPRKGVSVSSVWERGEVAPVSSCKNGGGTGGEEQALKRKKGWGRGRPPLEHQSKSVSYHRRYRGRSVLQL